MKITAVVGSYHRGGMVETAVDELLAAAQQQGAEVHKINLLDAHIEFCANCQSCTQEAGPVRGTCRLRDDMAAILDRLDASDAIVLASPMNFWTVTALMKRFIERLVCYGYWPWGAMAPKARVRRKTKRAAVVVSSAAPGWLARYFTSIVKLLKGAASLLGARRVDTLCLGLARHEPDSALSDRARAKARALGKKLATPR
ncbi:MAG: flavodoxin family protein [Thermoguttaceae bacterium]|jgi:multimeric flavodoxin WrbA|nr:flavodoxin family protein [Thermoguttaceae bacterium]